ncbi:growth-regulating factor 12-like [Aristolochia californica]|uniref:growth-regulating factor 12-like n=1 Tax=Aristolochia californica TaxID=171875 RepID=UPI0035DF4DD2
MPEDLHYLNVTTLPRNLPYSLFIIVGVYTRLQTERYDPAAVSLSGFLLPFLTGGFGFSTAPFKKDLYFSFPVSDQKRCFLGISYNLSVFPVAYVKMETASVAANLHPTKLARFSDPGVFSMAVPSVSLGLGLGPSWKSAFTSLQLQELEHQALIFKYMVVGVPVPFHLVLPIWKSVVSSAEEMYKQQPAWLGCSSLCFDHRNSTEPEPGRCRRTDGKKWRCSKDVVPDQKYCERHIHRGRHRSRKPVEGNNTAANTSSSSNNNINNLSKTTASMDSTHLSISIPVGLELMTNNHAATSVTVAHTGPTGTNIGRHVSLQQGFSPTSVLQASACKTES